MSKLEKLRESGAYRHRQQFEEKRFPAFVKEIDAEQGIVQHYVAIFGNLDDGGDIIMPGAFAKTISENARRVRVLDCHNYDSVRRVIGKPLALREVSRQELPREVLEYAPDATGALLATTQYAMDTEAGRDVFNLIKGGFLPETSIGYDAIQEDYETIEQRGKKTTARLLKEIRLWEYSNVIWGMNPATATVSAKHKENDTMAIKRVVPVQDAPLAPRETEWDGAAAEARVREWATNDAGELDWTNYRRAFMWYDSEEPEQFGSYHLGVGDIIDGDLAIVPRGVFTVAAALRGSRGAELPYLSDADRERVTNNVNRYYERMRAEFEDEGIVSPLSERTKVSTVTIGGEPYYIFSDGTWSSGDGVNSLYMRDEDSILEAPQGGDIHSYYLFKPSPQDSILRKEDLIYNESEKGNTQGLLDAFVDRMHDSLTAVKRDYNEMLEFVAGLKPGEATKEGFIAAQLEKAYHDDEHSMPLVDYIQACVYMLFDNIANDALVNGKISREQRVAMSGALEAALDTLDAQFPADVAQVTHDYYEHMSAHNSLDTKSSDKMPDSIMGIPVDYDNPLDTPPWMHGLKFTGGATAKSGRAISKANETRISAAIQAMHDAVSALQMLLEDAGIDVEDAAPRDDLEGMSNTTEFERLKLLRELQTL